MRIRTCPWLLAAGLTGLLLAACIEPDPTKPWSTRDQSVTTVEEGLPQRVVVVEESSPASSPLAAGDSIIETTMMPEVAEPVRPKNVGPVVLTGATPAARATSWLLQAVTYPEAVIRANAFEALEGNPEALYEVAPLGFIDENRGVRFIATMSVGDAGLDGLAALIEPLVLDPSDSVRASAIYALNALDQYADPSPLGGMVFSNSPEIRGNAYLVLGLMGNPTAIPVIKANLGKGMRLENAMRVRLTELQAAEALVRLGDEDSIEPIRAALFTPVEQGEITVLACDMLGRLGDEQARSMLFRLIVASGNQSRPPEIQMAAAAALFRLGPPLPNELSSVVLSQVNARDPRRRLQAAAILGIVPGPGALAALEGLLTDAEPMVRTAAAGSILTRTDSWGSATAIVPD
ncbi:MAG: HEAT repeat domain-containing protein [Phycisphaera sp. TMED9]|nr:MAG: HEAT repeat domain-containing protein [Phycisphaera sp. TMED9]